MNSPQFNQMMEQIDQELRGKDVPIWWRPIHAISEVSKRLNTDIIFTPESAPVTLGRYDNLTLAAHVNKWFQDRYGDRLKVHLGPGSVALLIRGDPWKMVLPQIYGSVSCNCGPDIEKARNAPRISTGSELPQYNVLCCIEGFPARLANILSESERREILQFFMKAHKALQMMKNISEKPYVNEAIGDLQLAVESIFSRSPQYGMSKWSSLQFIEKLLKSFLKLKNRPIPRHHDLQKIAQTAQSAGLKLPNAALLASVQCVPGVRYGEPVVTLEDAIAAHHASLDLGEQLAAQIKVA